MRLMEFAGLFIVWAVLVLAELKVEARALNKDDAYIQYLRAKWFI